MATGDRSGDTPTRLTEPAVDSDLSRRLERSGTTSGARGEERDHALVRRFTLLVTAGPDTGEQHVSTGEKLVVGTHASCDLLLHDATVSRFHCEIVLAGKAVAVRDLESSNGTLVDGVSVLHAYLRGAAVLTLGRTQLRFDTGGEPVRVPLSVQERFGGLVGSSTPMRRAFGLLERALTTNVSVLLEGETGSGKASAAAALHAEGPRRAGPFVVFPCETTPPERFERDLLGPEGAMQAARGGTLYLREVGDVPGDLQPRLAALLQAEATGPDAAVRVVGGTRRSLRVDVNGRRFRSDLYLRLAGIECRLPALREHPEDLPLLVEDALARLRAADQPEAERLRTRDFYAELGRHGWPGNVRELQELVQLTLGARVSPATASGAAREDASLAQATVSWQEAFERRYLEGLLAKHGANLAALAQAAGLDRVRLGRLLERHGLRP